MRFIPILFSTEMVQAILGIGFEKPKPDIEDAEYEEVKNETQAESETEATETQETGKKPRKTAAVLFEE